MKSIIAILVLTVALSNNAFAVTRKLFCTMGDIGFMDIEVSKPNGNKEKITVILSDEEGIPTVYINSNFKNGGLLKSLATHQEIDVIVSQSDLKAMAGGAYLDAGVLNMYFNEETKRYDTMFAAEGIVFNASCL